MDALVNDPSGLPPICGEQQFAEIMESIVADFAPRLFAIVQEYGERVDGKIVAWGMAFEDRADVVGVDGGVRMGLDKPEDALPFFGFGTHIKSRLVWVNPDAASPPDEIEDDAENEDVTFDQ
ncbi:MAG TPA: hypothetical protein VG317_07790 [Pseudonocardiaceae bacterium]|nr:hypothetical protein [Pseudonocardiaceae bacterium]